MIGQTERNSGAGVVAQYVVKSDADTGFFIGFEGAITQQDASDTTTVSLPPLFSADVEPQVNEIRVAVVYRVNVADVLGAVGF